jgi:hypothetical protein
MNVATVISPSTEGIAAPLSGAPRSARERQLRGLKKKLRQIRRLEAARDDYDHGRILTPEEVAKVGKRHAIEKRIRVLMQGLEA